MRGAGNQNQIRLGDDCLISGPRCSERQSLSNILLIGTMRLSLFCNACQKSGTARDEGWGWFALQRTVRQQRRHVRVTTGACAKIVRVIFFRGNAMCGQQCPRRTEQQTSAAAEGACAESPLGGTVATQASACSGAVENFKSPKHHDDSRYQRGRHQHTFQGSDSHPLTLRFPAPLAV